MISRFGVGIGTAAATVNDTALVSQYLKSLDGYDVSVAGQVTFHWSLGFSEANGMTISEFGLFCADDTLFAHKVRGGIVKEEDLSFEGDWTIVF